MFRTSPVHLQERFVQAVCADLVCGTTVRTTRPVQPLRFNVFLFLHSRNLVALIYCRGYELVELYLHSPICTGTNIIYALLNNFKSYGKTAAFT